MREMPGMSLKKVFIDVCGRGLPALRADDTDESEVLSERSWNSRFRT
jgi:hypothetical protein